MEKDILKEIIAHKRKEVEAQKRCLPADRLIAAVDETEQRITNSIKHALTASSTGIIAEFKRRSPSKGWINRHACPEQVIPAYEKAGAAAISILTDEAFFAGTLNDLTAVRPLTSLPILRKDFIIDTYQLLQARAAGADAILLIAACLDRNQCNELTQQAHELKLEVLLELHNPDELAYLDCGADLTGINNRSLGTFYTDASYALNLAQTLIEATKAMPQHPLLVAESGIHDPETACQLRLHGYRGLLIGERFMRSERPGEELRTFIQHLSHLHNASAL